MPVFSPKLVEPKEASVSSELRSILVLTFPVIFTRLSFALLHLVDAWMLGRLGKVELASVASSGLLIAVLVRFGTGYFASVTVYVSQSLGKNSVVNCACYGWQGIYAALILGVGLTSLHGLSGWIFGLFGHEPEVMRYEIIYFELGLLSVLPQLASIAISNYLIGIHRTMMPMVAAVLGTIANVVLNYGLIFGALGFPAMGFAGAAVGTVVASLFQAILLFACFFRYNRLSFLELKSPRRFAERQLKMARIGVPAGFQEALDMFTWGVLLTWFIGIFGTAHLAAATVLTRLMYLAYLPAEGLAESLITIVGRSIGKGKITLAAKQADLVFRVNFVYMALVAVLFYIFRWEIMETFNDDPQVVMLGVSAMIFVSLFQLFDAANMTYLNALQGAGDNLWPALANGIICVVVFVGGGLLVVRVFPQLGALGVWGVATAYVAAQAISFWSRWARGTWRSIDLHDENEKSSPHSRLAKPLS